MIDEDICFKSYTTYYLAIDRTVVVMTWSL